MDPIVAKATLAAYRQPTGMPTEPAVDPTSQLWFQEAKQAAEKRAQKRREMAQGIYDRENEAAVAEMEKEKTRIRGAVLGAIHDQQIELWFKTLESQVVFFRHLPRLKSTEWLPDLCREAMDKLHQTKKYGQRFVVDRSQGGIGYTVDEIGGHLAFFIAFHALPPL